MLEFFRKIKEKMKPESLRFIEGLCKKEEPSIDYTSGFYCGTFRFDLRFSDVLVEILYDKFRQKWDMTILSQGHYLYYRTCSGSTAKYLINRYKLYDILNPVLKKEKIKDSLKNTEEESIKKKYLA